MKHKQPTPGLTPSLRVQSTGSCVLPLQILAHARLMSRLQLARRQQIVPAAPALLHGPPFRCKTRELFGTMERDLQRGVADLGDDARGTAPSGFLRMTRRSLGSTGVTMRPPSGRSSSSSGPSLAAGQAAPQCTRSYCPCSCTFCRKHAPQDTGDIQMTSRGLHLMSDEHVMKVLRVTTQWRAFSVRLA